jgi:TolB-like protein
VAPPRSNVQSDGGYRPKAGVLPIELGSLKRSFHDAELPLVAKPGSIRDHAAEVAGGLEMAGGGGDERASGSTPAVFMSYASQDVAVANAVVETLERHGVKCWIAPRDVVPGEFYAGAIVHAIDAAKVIVLVLSENAATSQHVLREVERATSKRHAVVAFRVDLAPMPADLEYFLNTSHWLDASAAGIAHALPKLVDAVQRITAAPTLASPGDTGVAAKPVASLIQQPPSARSAIHRANRPVLVLSALIALGLGYFAVDKLWFSRRTESEQAVATVTPVASAVTSAVSERSVAVLPFLDLSEKKDQEYFADGMAEEIIDLLTKVPELKVIGRTSSFQFKGKADDLRKIGMTLGAAYVVEGSVRRSDNHVRVTAQLIDSRDGTHRWAETYDRTVSDVLKVQDEIALGLVRALQLEVASTVFGGSRSAPPAADAYDSYLRGMHARDRFDQRGFEEALADFRHALQLEPSFAPAAEALASTLYYMTESTYLPAESGFKQARAAGEAALKLDPGSAVAHAVICSVNIVFDWNWSAAAPECAMAAQISPNKPFVLQAAAIQHMVLGEWKDATYLIETAIVNDPLDPALYNIAARIYIRAGRVTDAESAVRRALQISPTAAFNHLVLGITLLIQGRPREALAEMQQEHGPGARELGLAVAYHALHRDPDADAALARLKAENGSDSAFFVAEVYAFRGQKDPAFEWLERAFVQRDNDLYDIKGAWLLKNLEGDPRYKAFLRKMNLPE